MNIRGYSALSAVDLTLRHSTGTKLSGHATSVRQSGGMYGDA